MSASLMRRAGALRDCPNCRDRPRFARLDGRVRPRSPINPEKWEPAMFARSSLLASALLLVLAPPPAVAADPAIAPKVLVITMFGGEAKPWLDGDALGQKITVPGLSKALPGCRVLGGGLVHDDDRHGLRQCGEFDRGARLRRPVRPHQNLFSHFRHRGRRSGPRHAWLSALGALCRRRRAAERDRSARGAGGLELGLSGDRRAGARREGRAALRRRSLSPQRGPAAGGLSA